MKKVTLSIGIPAYNEEKNIAQLLHSIAKQRQDKYKLESVYVICDGCTDNTVQVVEDLSRKYSFIKLYSDKKRKGKADALNRIYDLNRSEYLLTIDADLVIVNKICIDNMILEITKNKSVNLVGPRHICVKPNSFMGKFAYISYVSFEDAFLKLNKGNNFYAMMGAGLMRKELTDSFKFPKGTISDQCYLYAVATRNNKNGFKLVRKAQVLFRPVSTFMDWRALGVRSVIGDKRDVAKHFGKEILNEYRIPKKLYFMSLLKWLIKSPVLMTGSVLMNLYIRKFPYTKLTPKNGIWQTTDSSKERIYLNVSK